VPPLGTEPAFPTLVMYPSGSAEASINLGPYPASLAMDGSVVGGSFPLVVVSHGTGGSPLLYRGLAAHLARDGFIVALPEHPGNNRNNNELAGTATILADRPRHIRRVIDHLASSQQFGSAMLPQEVAVIGHSLGAYTALAVAGGQPEASPLDTGDGSFRRVEVVPDNRVAALVLLAPATPWFLDQDSLRQVRVPILMFTAERDADAPAWNAEIVSTGVADRALVRHRVAPGAGHFSFLSPFPAAMSSPGFPPSQDPAGFDRVAFHVELNEEVLAFLREAIGAP